MTGDLRASELVLRGGYSMGTIVTDWHRMARLIVEIAAHTISQRLRQLRKIPPELIPLGIHLFDYQNSSIGLTIYRYCRWCRCRVCRLLHGPKARCRQANETLSPEPKGLRCRRNLDGRKIIGLGAAFY
jgi:hypothetical protein